MAQNLQPPLFGAGPVLDTELDDDFEDFLIPDSSKFDLTLGLSAQQPTFANSFGQLSERNGGEMTGNSMFDGASENRSSPAMDLPTAGGASSAAPIATHSSSASEGALHDFSDRPGGRAKRNSAKAASSRISAAIESERSAPPKKSKPSSAEAGATSGAGAVAGGSGSGSGSGPLVKVTMASIRRPTVAETVAAAASAAAAAAAAAVEEVEGGSDEDGWDEDEFEDDDEGGEGTGKRKRRAGDPDDRLARSRERNRLHARKSRLRKKFFVDSLKSNLEELEAENRKLRAFIEAKCGVTYEDLQAEGGGSAGAHPSSSATVSSAAAEDKRGAGAGARTSSTAAHTLLARPGQEPSAVLEGSDFQLVEALTKSQQNFVISDPNLPDNPIVFASAGFYELTGYAPDEVIGRNCRFLQGPKTDPDAITAIRQSIQAGRDCAVCLINYKKDGTPFWNRFFVAPLKGVDGKIVNFVGVQCEVKANVASALMTVQGGPHKEYAGNDADRAAALMAGAQGPTALPTGQQGEGSGSASSKVAGASGAAGSGSKSRKR